MSGHNCPECGESFPSSSCALGGSIGHDCAPITYAPVDRAALASLINADPFSVGVSPAELAMSNDRAYRIADRLLATYKIEGRAV